jgi:hypothetical protein
VAGDIAISGIFFCTVGYNQPAMNVCKGRVFRTQDVLPLRMRRANRMLYMENALAKMPGYDDAAEILSQTLEEEKAANNLLTQIAEI